MLRKLIIALCVSIAVMLLNYFACNMSYPLAGEKDVLQGFEIAKSLYGKSNDSIPDDVLLVNVAYDKTLTDYSRNGLPIGQYTITDRRKLLDFLTKAHEADNYKYIMLDVVFERGIETDVDSALFSTILSMPRIVIATHEDAALQDSALYKKAANADYSITLQETDFVRYQFLHHGVQSMPLVVYEDEDYRTINKYGWFYTCDGHLCSNGVTLKLPIRTSHAFNRKDDGMHERNFLYLGADILAVDSIIPVSEQIDGKLVVIGDFNGDVHPTYAGDMPGSMICLNAYYALLRGDHIVSYPFSGVLFIIYMMVALTILNGWSLSVLLKNKWLRLLISFISLTACFISLGCISYITAGIVYNPVVPTILFTGMRYVTDIVSKAKSISQNK